MAKIQIVLIKIGIEVLGPSGRIPSIIPVAKADEGRNKPNKIGVKEYFKLFHLVMN